jgi:hypothetical protein
MYSQTGGARFDVGGGIGVAAGHISKPPRRQAFLAWAGRGVIGAWSPRPDADALEHRDGGEAQLADYPSSLEIRRTQPAVLGETCEHPRPEFLPVVEREDEVRPAGTSEHLVRAGLALDGPTDAKKCGENEAGSSAAPVAHAALKEMLR